MVSRADDVIGQGARPTFGGLRLGPQAMRSRK